MELQLRKLVGDKRTQRLGLDILLCLDLAGKHLAIILSKEVYLKRGIILAIVIDGDVADAYNFLKEKVLRISSLEFRKCIVAKEHILRARVGKQGEQATIKQVDFEGIVILVELQWVLGTVLSI